MLGFGLGEPFVVVAGGGEQQVNTGGLVHFLRHDGGVEHDGQELLEESGEVVGLSSAVDELEVGLRYAAGSRGEPLLGELRQELILGIVVMDTVGEPYALEVLLHEQVLRVLLVGVVEVDTLEGAADGEVVTAVLVVEDVASLQGSLSEIIDKGLLLKGKRVEVRYLVPKHFEVIEFVHVVIDFLCFVVPAREGEECQSGE